MYLQDKIQHIFDNGAPSSYASEKAAAIQRQFDKADTWRLSMGTEKRYDRDPGFFVARLKTATNPIQNGYWADGIN